MNPKKKSIFSFLIKKKNKNVIKLISYFKNKLNEYNINLFKKISNFKFMYKN